MLNKKLFLIIIAILSTQIVFGAVIHRQYDFSAPQVILNHGRSELVMEGCLTAGKPGNPPLPQFPIKLLLPPGEAITEVIISPQELTVSHTGVTLDPALNLYPFSYQGEIAPTIPNPLIYQTDGYYPSDLIESYQTQYLCGHSIGYVTIYPVQYNPMSGEIAYFKYIKVTVITAPYNRAQEAYNSNYRSRNSDRSRVERIVENDEAVQQYGVLDETDDPVVPYLIMVPQDMYYSLQPLADFKTQRGMITELYLLEDVFLNYTGMDIQDQIRNCIIDYYQNYGTEYVLLAGDDEYILHRGLFASDPQMEEDIAADIYYAGLDGNWNIDGDQWWGEPFEADLLAEVYVGRCASDSPTEAANFVNKQIGYQSTPVFNELATALMVGEDLGWAVWGSEIKEEVRNGSSSAGYTSAGISANFTVNTLYDTPTWSFSGTGNLIPLLNGGPNLVNHMGHASRSYMMKLNTSQVNSGSCTNNGSNANYYIVYSQGCYCGSFDNRNANGSYGTDCITEKFSIIETGAVAMITNSRYGWGNGYNTNGPSQYYDRQFYDAIFGENITIIGQTNQDSKEDNIPFIGSATYWCYYQLNLFADPTLDIWTAEPVELIPVCQNFIGVGMDFFELQIPGVQGAWCALVSNNELLGWAQTDANGNAVIELNEPITSVIPLTLNITAHNYIPYSEPLDVVNLSYPFMMPELNSIGDGITGD
nr:hypothetical protein [FCB group bacterium]